MPVRALRFLVPVLLACQAADGSAAPAAAGRHWEISIDRIECEAAASRVLVGTRIRYVGPRGVAEAPISRLVDGDGRANAPTSLAWQGGSKPLAAWLSAGGLRDVPAGEAGEVRFRFEVGEAAKELTFEFGDIPAFSLTRTGGAGGLCERLLKPSQLAAVRTRRARVAESPGFRIYRNVYPCLPASRGTVRTVEAQYPPQLPEQLLVFGRGYLPNARQVELPMGKAAAQSYVYAGAEELNAIETAARRALLEDFPQYARAGYFAFNWGAQAAASGNRMYSIGIYAVRPCPT